MPRARRRREEVEEEEDDVDEASPRDFAMARIGAAICSTKAAMELLMEAMAAFVSPEALEDPKGTSRKELLEEADDALGLASRCTQEAQGTMDDIESDEIALEEADILEEADA